MELAIVILCVGAATGYVVWRAVRRRRNRGRDPEPKRVDLTIEGQRARH